MPVGQNAESVGRGLMMNLIPNEQEIAMVRYFVTRERKEKIRATGHTHDTIARRLRVTRQMVTHVISGYRRTPWIREGIVRMIDADYREFWGADAPELTTGDIKRLKKIGIEAAK